MRGRVRSCWLYPRPWSCLLDHTSSLTPPPFVCFSVLFFNEPSLLTSTTSCGDAAYLSPTASYPAAFPLFPFPFTLPPSPPPPAPAAPPALSLPFLLPSPSYSSHTPSPFTTSASSFLSLSLSPLTLLPLTLSVFTLPPSPHARAPAVPPP